MYHDNVEQLSRLASALGSAGVPIFIFQEGRDPVVQRLFRMLALKSGGAYFEFNPDKVDLLAEQLGVVARLAVGDTEALEKVTGAMPNRPAALIGSRRRAVRDHRRRRAAISVRVPVRPRAGYFLIKGQPAFLSASICASICALRPTLAGLASRSKHP